eukprot:1162058-Pelagomonas_calceolata.AAC.5
MLRSGRHRQLFSDVCTLIQFRRKQKLSVGAQQKSRSASPWLPNLYSSASPALPDALTSHPNTNLPINQFA